jgi:hypothetical protein
MYEFPCNDFSRNFMNQKHYNHQKCRSKPIQGSQIVFMHILQNTYHGFDTKRNHIQPKHE